MSTPPPSTTLPRTVLILGLVSLLMDLSSETIHALLPLFMVNMLGLGAIAIGVIDGAAEALTLAIKPLAGRLSDRWRRRKVLALAGYGLSALAKPLFALAGGLGLVATARALDRFGKGLRGAPRDALIADVTPPDRRGAAYGLRQALDTVGALLAPLLAAGLLWWLAGDYRAVFWLASLPAFAAVLLLALAVAEPTPQAARPSSPGPGTETSAGTGAVPDIARATASPERSGPLALPRTFWWVVGFACLLTLARPAESFLILRGQSLQLGDYASALLLAMMNLSYALTAWPVGRHFDRFGATALLLIALLWLALSQWTLALAESLSGAIVGALLWGLHLGFSQGVLAALVARHAPAARRATAFGWFALAVGLALLGNGLVFGSLWQLLSPQTAFAVTGSAAVLALVLALLLAPRLRRQAANRPA